MPRRPPPPPSAKARAAEAQARYQRELLRAREEEERNRIYANPPFFFLSPALRQRHSHPPQPSQPSVDIHIGHKPDHDKSGDSTPPKTDGKSQRITVP